ncbi:MAG: SRPBCC domain-containing protein [Chloroflexi bacterium]|nr:SRPBCC domain-containing protein [Chloroflexota bacterium]
MSTVSKGAAPTDGQAFQLTRVFDAPRELVFRAFTEREHLFHWWGPKGFVMLACDVDLRPGGLFRYGMRAPNGAEMWGRLVFREIVSPERIVFINSFTDAAGTPIRHPMEPNWPLEVLSTLTFSEHDGKTVLTSTSVPFNATETEARIFEAASKSMEAGFKGTYGQLDAYLASLRTA